MEGRQDYFDNTSLKDALRILEKRYNVVFIQKNPARKAAFTGTFTSQRLERILEYFNYLPIYTGNT